MHIIAMTVAPESEEELLENRAVPPPGSTSPALQTVI